MAKKTAQKKSAKKKAPTPIEAVRHKDTRKNIPCWFIDTEYNGESLFVRHAYFTGANEPYDKLKRAESTEAPGARSTARSTARFRNPTLARSL